ncbi:MAG: disulfide oxidoreductase [Deltaproteobacteria bacterium]|nr:disulfide oxidoreductase [Deltaproteobacteria bacterium]
MSLISRVLDRDGSVAVTAVLGPTNTAREVYDRVCVERGPDQVALVTGEEKRIPDNPRYFVCTVEAMPLDRPVAFLAVDEVQLAADRTRGHVFTDRILHARGLLETMLLGSDTIAPLLRKLVPSVEVERQPRMSQLTYAGASKLTALPRRSAVVAFSVAHVYQQADRLRHKHGGVAVVVGALSPRTRNAQVAMFQSGEVPYMVATDAIGMGLNLDLDHVAFTELGKYDGIGYRELSSAEVAQIAGRAGRYHRDGTFGATNALGELDYALVEALEGHQFPPLEALYWRNSDLDPTSVDSLLSGLTRRAPHRFLYRMRDAEDHQTLEALARRPEIAKRATSPPAVALLWDVCQVPDYRKTLTDSHAVLVSRIYCQLVDQGVLDTDWVARRIKRLDHVDGDIDALTTRIAFVRTWSFLSYRREWMPDATGWQERTRAIEDRLSDVLHEELTRRFVDRRVMVLTAAGERGEGLVDAGGVVRVGELRVGVLAGFTFRADRETVQDKALHRAVRGAVREEVARRVETMLAADFRDLTLSLDGTICWHGAQIGRWVRGSEVLAPQVRGLRHELVPPDARERLGRALQQWTASRLGTLLEPVADEPSFSPEARSLLHALRRGLGGAYRADLEDQVSKLTDADRHALARRGVRLGMRTVYALPMLKPEAVHLRAVLWGLWKGADEVPDVPTPGAISVPRDPGRWDVFYRALGFLPLGPRVVRADVVEKVSASARRLARKGPFEPPDQLMTWIGCGQEDLAGILEALGFERLPGEPVRFRGTRTRRGRKGRGRRPPEWG